MANFHEFLSGNFYPFTLTLVFAIIKTEDHRRMPAEKTRKIADGRPHQKIVFVLVSFTCYLSFDILPFPFPTVAP